MKLKESLIALGMAATVASTVSVVSTAHAAPGLTGIKKKPAVRVTRPGLRKPVVKKQFSPPKRRIVQPKG
ncbi:hypothetical protein OAK75_01700 [Bacteriovoracales bacterium]|nr:hypothetical protein [Bacteriovoracales bacterium]